MQYPESTSVAVEQAWSKPGSLKPRGGHHLEPQGFKGLFVSGTVGHSYSKWGVASPCCQCRTPATSQRCIPASSAIGTARFR
jgi:hypothetical protein